MTYPPQIQSWIGAPPWSLFKFFHVYSPRKIQGNHRVLFICSWFFLVIHSFTTNHILTSTIFYIKINKKAHFNLYQHVSHVFLRVLMGFMPLKSWPAACGFSVAGTTKPATTSGSWDVCWAPMVKIWLIYPRWSMYGIFTYMWVIYGVNVCKYTIHGSSGYG